MPTKIVAVGSERLGMQLQLAAAASELEIVALEQFDLNTERRLLEEQPVCVVVEAAERTARAFCALVRQRSALADIQIIAVVEDPWSETVPLAFSMGADDFVSMADVGQLLAKVAAMADEHAAVGRNPAGKIILADASRERRVLVGRHLRRTGLEIQFAANTSFEVEPSVCLVVAHAELFAHEGAAATLAALRGEREAELPLLVIGSAAQLGGAREQLAGQPNVAVLDIETDASPVVFIANGLVAKEVAAARRTARLPYATPVRYETADDGKAQWGYSYNINRGGLYVRTVTPPPVGASVCLELKPPHGRGRVVVDATVVWRQGFSTRRGNPPGFGVRFADTLDVADAAALEAGYAQLAQQLEARPSISANTSAPQASVKSASRGGKE